MSTLVQATHCFAYFACLHLSPRNPGLLASASGYSSDIASLDVLSSTMVSVSIFSPKVADTIESALLLLPIVRCCYAARVEGLRIEQGVRQQK